MHRALVMALLGLSACATSDRSQPSSDADAVADASDHAGADGGSASPDSGPRAQPNTSFETAHRLHGGDAPWLQDERSADQVDYYVFAGKTGEIYELSTDDGQFMPDNVVSLYDAQHELIASNDYGSRWPGDGIDARLVVRLPDDGDYYVTVEDLFTPADVFASSTPLLFYHLHAGRLSNESAGVAIREDNSKASKPLELVQDATTGYRYGTVIVQLGASEQSVELVGHAGEALLGSVPEAGPQGNGSTAQGGELRISDDAQHQVARIDRTQGQHTINPPLTDGVYQLTFGAVNDLGNNPFRVVDLVMGPENPAEQHDASNGKLASAEPLELEGSGYRAAFLLLQVPTNDVDYFGFTVAAGELVDVSCEAESSGSGARQLHAELRDGSDSALATADETGSEALDLAPTAIVDAGVVYLRLSTKHANAAGVEPWARCRIEVSPPLSP